MSLQVTEGRILFQVVKEAFDKNNYTYQSKNPQALLVWNDTIRDLDYFSMLEPYQIVNRLPNINLLCRKAPFIRLLQRVAQFFPNLYTFLPNSYILPLQNTEFISEINRKEKKYIVKPDNGSLGSGIQIIDVGQTFSPGQNLSIAQEYVESYLINQTKFDLRVYVLVASITPLEIYVYRNGVARFCSQTEDGSNSIFSQITNTAVNRHNKGVSISSITRMISDVFAQMKTNGVDIDLLWKKIDETAVATVITAYQFLVEGQDQQCPNVGYSRCFQILGFDILIDKDLNPTILEVNYRPSLETDTDAEKSLKIQMLSEAMKIAAPVSFLQHEITEEKSNVTVESWKRYITRNTTLLNQISNAKRTAEANSQFVKAFPSNTPKDKVWLHVIDRVRYMATEVQGNLRLPVLVVNPTRPNSKREPSVITTPTKEVSTRNRTKNGQQISLIKPDTDSNKNKTNLNNKQPVKLTKQVKVEAIMNNIPHVRQVSNTISFSLLHSSRDEQEPQPTQTSNPKLVKSTVTGKPRIQPVKIIKRSNTTMKSGKNEGDDSLPNIPLSRNYALKKSVIK